MSKKNLQIMQDLTGVILSIQDEVRENSNGTSFVVAKCLITLPDGTTVEDDALIQGKSLLKEFKAGDKVYMDCEPYVNSKGYKSNGFAVLGRFAAPAPVISVENLTAIKTSRDAYKAAALAAAGAGRPKELTTPQ